LRLTGRRRPLVFCTGGKAGRPIFACYLGKIAYMISRSYPSGFVDVEEPRVAFKAEWADDLGKEGKGTIDGGSLLGMQVSRDWDG
jgi:hypothetical protein